MKINFYGVVLLALLTFILAEIVTAQNPVLLKRTAYKTESFDFGAGGTISVIGAPNGSIEIEGWQKNQVEIITEIEVQAANEADLAKLAEISGYSSDVNPGHLSIESLGSFKRDYLKRVAKKFPKNLLTMPLKIDYKIKVPLYSDLEIDGGSGKFKVSNVDGALKVNFLSADAELNLIGGTLSAVFGAGNISVTIPTRAWRGRFAEVQVVKGNLNVSLPVLLNAEITAKVLRNGQIENSYKDLKPVNRGGFADQTIIARAGSGGVALNFTVGDGTLKLAQFVR